MKNIEARPLFIFEMANNHAGSMKHGLKIIKEFYKISKFFNFSFGFKLQYRDIDTFIHPEYKKRYDLKYVKRYSETKLTKDEYKILKDAIDTYGFLSVCTPWDEISVDWIEEHGFDFIKIPSCYLTDWPLIERVGRSDKPVIASTAGATFEDIDKVVSFFEHRSRTLHLMHCVGEYPTPDKNLQLNQIDLLKTRYPRHEIGYSTHEKPENIDAIKISIAKGATIFERHVGVTTDTIKLNAYSSTPEQIRAWLEAADEILQMCGHKNSRYHFSDTELQTIRELQKGVFAKEPIAKNSRVKPSEVFYAIPNCAGQIVSNDMSKYVEFHTLKDIKINQPILNKDVSRIEVREKLLQVVAQIKKLLKESGVVVPSQLEFEVSHHYGLENFEKFGAVLITVVNREYCKKIIVLLPGQTHPEGYHKKKEETFHVLYGEMTLILDGVEKQCRANDIIVVLPGVKHSFLTKTGVIIEEISTSHFREDSFYTDASIEGNKNRKTSITYWFD